MRISKIKKWMCTALLPVFCQGAVVSVCSTGCTTPSLQAAFDSVALCGDTIQISSAETQSGNFTITYRGCTAGTPITVTTDRANWLPPSGGRVSPSHLANMAVIATPNADPALKDVLDGMGRPPAHWVFRGVAFRSNDSSVTFFPVHFNSHEASNGAELADDITFDQTLFYSQLPNTPVRVVQDFIRADATNIIVKNSFFGDGSWPGVETHGIRMLTNPGPVTIINNFITTSSEPIFSGGNPPSYPAYMENGATVRYNYTWVPWKWNGDPLQPHAADYAANSGSALSQGPFPVTNVSGTGIVTIPAAPYFGENGQNSPSLLTISGVAGCTEANGSSWRLQVVTPGNYQLLNFSGCSSPYTSGGTATAYAFNPCKKNHGEMKWGSNILWEYNVAENMWFNAQCGSQWNGFTSTLRTNWDSPQGSSLTAMTFVDSTHLTWTGTYRLGGAGACCAEVSDLALCVSLPVTGTECHTVASYGPGAEIVTSVAFSAAPSGTYTGWIVYTASAKLTEFTLRNNVFKNTDTCLTNLALSFASFDGEAGKGAHQTYSNNLCVIDNPYNTGRHGISIGAGEADYAYSPSDFRWDHNTQYSQSGLQQGAWVYMGGTGCPSPTRCATGNGVKFEASSISNNLFGPSAAGGNGPFSGDSTGNVADTVNTYLSNSEVRNNVIPGGAQGGACTGGNSCSGNQFAAWGDPFQGLGAVGVFKLAPGTSYSGGATDGQDIGVDYDRLPLITGLKTTVSSRAALLEFNLAAPIRDAAGTQPCTLEVSASLNLHSDLDHYAVIDELNPRFFLQADSSARTNPLLAPVVVHGGHVIWPIGRNSTVMGNDGVVHNLALTPAATYYGRLMCYGDTKWFSFQTSKESGTSVTYPVSVQLRTGGVLGTTAVRVEYGPTLALGSQADFALDGDGVATVRVPLTNSAPVYYRLLLLSGTEVIYTGAVEALLGGA